MQLERHLTLAVERRAPDASGRYAVVISTSAPVDMGDALEVLSHEPGEVNLSRFPLPLLFNHERDKQIGIVENPSVTDGKLRAFIRFGSGQLANEIETDVKNGIRRNLSVAYYRNKVVESVDEKSGRPIFHTVAWQPYEASIVAVPADELAGVGRSLKSQEAIAMTTPTNNDARRTAELESFDATLAGFAYDRRTGSRWTALWRSLSAPKPTGSARSPMAMARHTTRCVISCLIAFPPNRGLIPAALLRCSPRKSAHSVAVARRQSTPATVVTRVSRSCAPPTRS